MYHFFWFSYPYFLNSCTCISFIFTYCIQIQFSMAFALLCCINSILNFSRFINCFCSKVMVGIVNITEPGIFFLFTSGHPDAKITAWSLIFVCSNTFYLQLSLTLALFSTHCFRNIKTKCLSHFERWVGLISADVTIMMYWFTLDKGFSSDCPTSFNIRIY